MIKQLLLSVLVVLTASQALAYPVHVQGHIRDGYWVNPYTRESPTTSQPIFYVPKPKPYKATSIESYSINPTQAELMCTQPADKYNTKQQLDYEACLDYYRE